MNYPLISEYIEAIKSAEDNFKELTNLRPVLGDDGQPVMTSGNFAVVFKMKDIETGKLYALKCFTKEQEGRGEAYHQIENELKNIDSPYLISISYFNEELFVDTNQAIETEFPVLLMDWVEGTPLDKYIHNIIKDGRLLIEISHRFKELSIWLLSQPFAHGDLKPDNILVKKDGSLVLVDYDGMFVPAMHGQKAREIASPDYRNPSRTNKDFDKNTDNFPIISILLSLEIIAEKSEYLKRFGKEDGLLFSHDDYLNLRGSSIFKRALTSYADDIPNLAVMLERMVNGEQCNIDSVKKLLLTNNWHERYHPNKEIERNMSWFVGGYFILVLFLPLYLRSVIRWHIVMLYVTTLLLIALMFLVLVFVDRLRPNKNEHISTIGNDGPAGFFWWITLIPLLLMADPFTNWFNYNIPFLSQPLYKDEWYITALMWVIWWYSGGAIISIPEYLLKWRLKHFKTQEEASAEQIEQELTTIRTEVKKEDKQWDERNKRNTYVYNDDLPF